MERTAAGDGAAERAGGAEGRTMGGREALREEGRAAARGGKRRRRRGRRGKEEGIRSHGDGKMKERKVREEEKGKDTIKYTEKKQLKP